MADEDNLVTIQLLGRNMQFRTLTPGQLLLANRLAQRASRDSGDEDAAGTVRAYKGLMSKMLDMIDTLFLSEQDREDVETALIQRKLDVEDILAIAFGGRKAAAPDDDADPVAAPKALKGKQAAAVAKLTKKTANPRRASR